MKIKQMARAAGMAVALAATAAAAGEVDVNDVNSPLLGAKPRAGLDALGDVAADLVFVPVTPCRLFDTRVYPIFGGQTYAWPIPPNSLRRFEVTSVSSYASQGGADNDCGVGNQGEFAAAVINITAVNPAADGYLTAFPANEGIPLASSLNYSAGDIVGNEVIVKLNQDIPLELSVFSYAQSDVVGDIVGYFRAPQATPLQCVDKASAAANIAPGAWLGISSGACDAGYSLVSGSCNGAFGDGRLITTRTRATDHFCTYRNLGTVSMQAFAYARCCRVPGR
ncbi:hypothetical protein [Arenimonas alkanexedens]